MLIEAELAFQDMHERLLGRIERERVVAQHAQRGAVHRSVVLTHDPFELRDIDLRLHACPSTPPRMAHAA